jgi:hypothetical protein
VERIYPEVLLVISVDTGHVHRTFLAAIFDDCFGHVLLTGCPIDLILFLRHF